MVDTILIDGNDVRTLPGCQIVGNIDGIYAPGTVRGDDDDVGNRDGWLGAELPLDRYIITIPLYVYGTSRGLRNDHLRGLAPLLLGTRGLVTLSRVIDTASGTATHTAPGRFITGLTPEQLNPLTGRINLQFYNLHGAWSPDGGSTWLLP